MKIACLTVVYPEMLIYLQEYLDCVKAQTYKNFDLIVVNDGLSEENLHSIEQLSNSIILPSVVTHQKNRLSGLQYCKENNYDVIVCSDSDETMSFDRIEKIAEYFNNNENEEIVFNNSTATFQKRSFDLFFKNRLTFDDLTDFNVLGYGAMNIRISLVPFILENANEKILPFDWWLVLIYLLNHDSIPFLPNVKNNYRFHEDNLVGPIFEINESEIEKTLLVKRDLYNCLNNYCDEHGYTDKSRLFKTKYLEMKEIIDYIEEKSIKSYCSLVKNYFKDLNKFYWWQQVVPLKKLRGNNYE